MNIVSKKIYLFVLEIQMNRAFWSYLEIQECVTRNRSVDKISLFNRFQMLAIHKYISSQAHYNFGPQMEVVYEQLENIQLFTVQKITNTWKTKKQLLYL